MIRFDGQSVIVTGAGRGLGRLYALELARRGAQVVVNDVGTSVTGAGSDVSVADAVVEEIERAGGTAVASHDSVDHAEAGAEMVQLALDTFGRLDAVVSNAGIFEMVAFEDMTFDQWRRMLQVHVDGTFHLVQPSYRHMKTQGYGRVVLVASNVGAFGQENAAHYATAKGGIIGLTNTLANEGAAYGIHVNTVLPMGNTRMSASTLEPEEIDAATQAFFDATPPERVVPMVVFLASRECELTHHYFSAGAGRFARVFIGLGDGWLADADHQPTVEDLVDHLDEVVALDPHIVPMSVTDEIAALVPRLHIL